MENYEVKGVSQATEIRKAYEEAVKANAPKYRAVSKTNLIYGWDEKANKFVKAEIGQEWFDNPHYVAPVEEKVEEVIEEPIEEAVEPIEQMIEVANEMVEEVKAKETVEEKVEEIDYKALYEQAQVSIKELLDENGKLREELEKKDNQIDDLQEELDDIQEAGQIIARLFK